MTIDLLRDTLGWCAILNMGVLIWWLFFISFANDWVFKMHSKFFAISKEQFDSIHYAGMGLFKLAIFFFNVVPYFALRIAA